MKIFKKLIITGVIVGLLCLIFTTSYVVYILRNIPSLDTLKNFVPVQVSFIVDRNGRLIDTVGNPFRINVKISNIPDVVKNAFIAAEDADFYKHSGINLKAILRSAVKDILSGSFKQGGSTITQQLARTLLLSHDKTIPRKIKEIYLAYKLEKSLDKDKILELYLNQIYLGSGAYGVEAASRTYFGKSITQATLPEAAILAGIPKAPSRYNPFSNPDLAKKRQRYVLKRMLEENFISREEYDKAISYTVIFKVSKKRDNCSQQYFINTVLRKIKKYISTEEFTRGGLIIKTGLDRKIQCEGYRALRKGLEEFSLRQEMRYPYVKIPAELLNEFLEFQKRNEVIPSPSTQVFLPNGEINTYIQENLEFKKGKVYTAVVTDIAEENNEKKVFLKTGKGNLVLSKEEIIKSAGEVESFYKKFTDDLKPYDVVFLKYEGEEIGKPFFRIYQEPYAEGGLVAMDNKTGEVVALIGGYSYERSQYNRTEDAHRQTGSAFKPIVYTTALINGFTPSTPVPDAPLIYKDTEKDEIWKPKNYSEKFRGMVPLRKALSQSINSVSVYLAEKIGMKNILKTARRFGITSPLNRDLSSALGSSSLTLEEMVRAYSVFPNLGVLKPTVYIEGIKTFEGKKIFQSETSKLVELEEGKLPEYKTSLTANNTTLKYKSFRVIDPNIAYVMVSLLKAVIKEGTGWRARGLNFEAGGKTGTTDEQRDAWFIGFSKRYTTGVWVGYDNFQPLGKYETGSRAACPIWTDFMQKIHRASPPGSIDIPTKVVFVKIDRNTGLKTQKEGVFQAYIEGTEPEEYVGDENDFDESLLKGEFDMMR